MDSVCQVSEAEGIFACPEGAATLAALKKMLASGDVNRDERVVLFNTGSGLKYTDLFEVDAPVVDPGKPFDYKSLL
jgi:threonine synthase